MSFSQVSLFLPSLNRKQSPLSFSISLNNSSYSISQQCLTALGQVAANADASTCLNIPALAQIISTPSTSSIVQPYNTWLSGLCGRPICSDATLTSIANIVGPACPTELQALGFTPTNFATEFKAFYPVFRKIICLKQSVSCRFYSFLNVIDGDRLESPYSGNTLCLTEFLTQIEKTNGTLTLTNALKLLTNPETLPKEITCSNCNKAAFNILAQADPTDANASKATLQQQCGAAFVGKCQTVHVV